MNIQSWLPSYDEWKDSYTRNELTREYVNSNNHTFPSMTHSMDQNELALHVRNVSFPTVTIDSDILDMLYEEGKDYLYGLLLHESIQLGSRPKDSDPTFSRDPHVTKVLWHADSNGGSNKNVTLFLQDTMTCLEPVLSNATGPCQIVVLAQDDLKYAQAISDRFPNCSIIKVRENAETESPAQVRQWLQQFSCDPTWSAFAGPRDGSIHLLRESLVFQRREMIWKLGQFPPSVPELVLCD